VAAVIVVAGEVVTVLGNGSFMFALFRAIGTLGLAIADPKAFKMLNFKPFLAIKLPKAQNKTRSHQGDAENRD
jgi:hypothetical protein